MAADVENLWHRSWRFIGARTSGFPGTSANHLCREQPRQGWKWLFRSFERAAYATTRNKRPRIEGTAYASLLLRRSFLEAQDGHFRGQVDSKAFSHSDEPALSRPSIRFVCLFASLSTDNSCGPAQTNDIVRLC